jgi:magnesium chelatase family protein
MQERHLKEFCPLAADETHFVETMISKYKLSTRRYVKLMRVARTVADTAGSSDITMYHLAAAFRYILKEKGDGDE